MLSDRINKIAKARQYALEAERFTIAGDQALVRGDQGEHHLSRRPAGWECDCDYFRRHGWCAHTLALEWRTGDRPSLAHN
jgi:hypothetical protein